MTEQTLNIKNMLIVVVLTALAVRWFMSKPANNAARPVAASRSGPRVSPAQIDQVASMFPQLDRRAVAWDLSRNGGNVSATTEKVLSGRALDTVSAVFDVFQGIHLSLTQSSRLHRSNLPPPAPPHPPAPRQRPSRPPNPI
jgi:coupling of ubiquitin conjugation to ER degradation protein 1